MSTTDRSLLSTILTLLDVLSSHKSEGKSWIHLLALLCIFAIVSQETTSSNPQTSPANPLQGLIGDLLKGSAPTKSTDATGSNMLMSLLPLLNSPQIKSKLNPANIAAVMNVVQNLSVPQAPPASEKPPQTAPTPPPVAPAPATTTKKPANQEAPPAGERYLDWKSSF